MAFLTCKILPLKTSLQKSSILNQPCRNGTGKRECVHFACPDIAGSSSFEALLAGMRAQKLLIFYMLASDRDIFYAKRAQFFCVKQISKQNEQMLSVQKGYYTQWGSLVIQIVQTVPQVASHKDKKYVYYFFHFFCCQLLQWQLVARKTEIQNCVVDFSLKRFFSYSKKQAT